MSQLFVAIHGIMTRQTATSWPDRFAAFAGQHGAMTLKKEYETGPFPMWNCWVLNPRLARSLVSDIEPWLEDRPTLNFVAHSNGCDIALRAIKLLAARGVRTHRFIATGAAIEADVERNGIADLLYHGMLGKAVAYSSKTDAAVKPPIIWPYGHLGCTGWTGDPELLDDRIITRWFPGFGHSTYFDDRHRTDTFHAMLADCL